MTPQICCCADPECAAHGCKLAKSQLLPTSRVDAPIGGSAYGEEIGREGGRSFRIILEGGEMKQPLKRDFVDVKPGESPEETLRRMERERKFK